MLDNFTPSQREAIKWLRMDACVVAGPGSGKTTVLVQRYRSLIEDHRFEPREILAITFTEKAAANMRAKLAEEFRRHLLLLRDLESAWVSTIHGFCARLLRENAIAAGIDPRFSVLDARESKELQFDSIHRALDEFMARRRTEALELIEALHAPDIARYLVDVYDAIRSSGKTIPQVRAMPSPGPPFDPVTLSQQMLQLLAAWPSDLTPLRRSHREDLIQWARQLAGNTPRKYEDLLRFLKSPINLQRVPPSAKEPLTAFREILAEMASSIVDEYTAPFRSLIFDVLAAFENLYQERKAALGALDFNDLERRSIELLLNSPETRDRVRSQFRQVMLDEFQDINEQQSELIRLVRGENVFFAVGDVNQSIYGFRHARPDIFHLYRESIKAEGKHSAELFENFRSREEILRSVEALTNDAEGIDPRALTAAASFLPKSGSSVEALKVTGANKEEASEREAKWLAHKIATLRGTLELSSGFTADFSDFAVLCRNSESMGAILDAFDQWKIPYVCGRRPSFLVSREGRDLTAVLHVILNPRDTIALATVLRSQLVGLSDEALLRLRLLANSLSGGINTIAYDPARLAAFDDRDAAKLTHFAASLKRWRAEQPVIALEVLVSRVLSDCAFPEGSNVQSYLHLARARGAGRNLGAFLRMVEGLETAVGTESDLADADQGNCVQVMTAHSAKGLEFPVTIIAAMEKGTRRDSAPVTFTPGIGLGLKWRSPLDDKGVADSWHSRNSEELSTREKEESSRLLYVAMTRAEEHLILSYATGDRQPSKWARLVEKLPQLEVLSQDPPEPAWHGDTPTEESATIAPPEVTDQHDSTVNVTSLAVFAQCPRKYYLQRYIGWSGFRGRFDPEDPLPSDDDPDTSAAELGSFVHDLLANKPADYPPEAHALAAVFQQSELGRLAANAIRVEREWDFIMDVDGTLVQGVIDLWFQHEGEISIVDYKTDSKVEPAAYAPQLALYALALERALGRRPQHAWLHYLRFEQVIEVQLDADVHGLIAQLKTAQNSLRFDLNEGTHCRSCSFYKGLCPAPLAG
jgi:ATP-dependent exoDNAse (exonuclease V) beta subunit